MSSEPEAPDDARHTEDRQGPDDADIHGTPDANLGGYFRVHDRPPAFEGSDAHPYTVSIEVEKTPDLRAPWMAYLVFPRWAATGVGIVGHVETPVLWKGRSEEDVIRQAGETPLLRVQELLNEAIRRKEADEED